MSTGSMRRAQLVTPFGVGAMSVLVNGTSVITGGLDHWYPIDNPNLALDEYIEHDWRLEERLKVREFRLPPDHRSARAGADLPNTKLTVPVLRFPRWCFCMYCKRLKRSTLSMAEVERCPDSTHSGKPGTGPRMAQVPFVAICTDGHLDDFPFDKWVHRSQQSKCGGTLRLFSVGGGGLEGQIVRCGYNAAGKRDETSGCGKERSLQGITSARPGKDGEEHTTLTDQLSGPDDPYCCTGARPWVHEMDGSCDRPVRGALRAAGNVYFPKVESSIFLPQHDGAVSSTMRELLRRSNVEPVLGLLFELFGADVKVAQLRARLPHDLFAQFSDEELIAAYRDIHGVGESHPEVVEEGDSERLTGDDIWRYPEFRKIRETPNDDALRGTDPGVHQDLAEYVERVRSVDVLRETRVLRGFTRGRDGEVKLSAGKAMLRRRSLPPEHDWLPAYVVKGEGVYLELDLARLAEWESKPEVLARADTIAARYSRVVNERGLRPRELTPRFVMLHTLAHLVINELVFTCGYSSASLRERLYVSGDRNSEMAGLLIYTAAGDSEGTMGGLVRMAQPGRLRSVLLAALADAHWCSTDPVCMDAGEKGQGPDSCNLAACHGCALLPETSCEEYNRFLDRGLVVGTFGDPGLGFFSNLS